MATNNNGSLLDTAGEVAIDFVWGNMAPQPNDARATRLNLALGDHINLESGWNGFPQFTPNTPGSDVAGAVNYVQVPNVLGLTTALATDSMLDSGLVPTTASAATNTAGVITAAARTAGSGVTTITDSAHGFVTGNKVTITATDATVNGTYTVTRLTNDTFTVTTTATTVLALSAITGSVVAVTGTIKAQSVAAGAATTAPGAAVTITPWA